MSNASRDPKALADWVELDYYARPRGMRLWRRRLTKYLFFGLLALLAVSVAASLNGGRTAAIFQAGPLSPAHVGINGDCAGCHTQPFRTAWRFSPIHSGVHSVTDAACKQCHADDARNPSTSTRPGPIAPPHNAIVLGEPNCATCHREHRGQVVLARVPDGDCLGCHENLKEHRPAGDSAFSNVTGFPAGHPEFALWRGEHKGLKDGKDDPGRIRFNHQKHLALDARFLPDGMEKLTCVQCHRPDESGRSMRPIKQETHCQDCHQGQRRVQLLGQFLDEKDRLAAEAFGQELVPHKEPQELRSRLNGRLLQFLDINPVVLGKADDHNRVWPQPKSEVAWAAFQDNLTSFNAGPFVLMQRQHLEGQLFDRKGGCAFCHDEKPKNGMKGERPPAILPEYELAALPDRWLRHGMFNHQRHLMVDCARCHDAEKSAATADVLIPKQAVCADCHSNGGGARFDCAECHKYHGRENDRAAAHTFPTPDRAKR